MIAQASAECLDISCPDPAPNPKMAMKVKTAAKAMKGAKEAAAKKTKKAMSAKAAAPSKKKPEKAMIAKEAAAAPTEKAMSAKEAAATPAENSEAELWELHNCRRRRWRAMAIVPQ